MFVLWPNLDHVDAYWLKTDMVQANDECSDKDD